CLLPFSFPYYSTYHLYLPSFPTRRSSDLESRGHRRDRGLSECREVDARQPLDVVARSRRARHGGHDARSQGAHRRVAGHRVPAQDRKSTRLNSSHRTISYAVFCLKKKKKK